MTFQSLAFSIDNTVRTTKDGRLRFRKAPLLERALAALRDPPRCMETCGDRQCFLDQGHGGECQPLATLVDS